MFRLKDYSVLRPTLFAMLVAMEYRGDMVDSI